MSLRKQLLIIVSMIALLPPAFALAVSVNTPSQPYEVMSMKPNITEETRYMGELAGDPHMYEFALGRETELSVRLEQLVSASGTPLSLIIVRANDNNRGVVEVGRLWGKEVSWQPYRNQALGLRLLESEVFSETIGAGIYRIEVSTPENKARYALVVGTTAPEYSYGEKLVHAYTAQRFFDRPWPQIITAAPVYFPLTIIIVFGISLTLWRKRNELKTKILPSSHA